MKLFLLAATTLSLMASLTDGAPKIENKSKKSSKSVKFNNNPTIIAEPPIADPDDTLIFNMIEKDFKANVQKISNLYEASSTERKFIGAIADVVQSNYGMYEKLYGYMHGLVSFDTELSQVRKEKSEDGTPECIFPDEKTFNKLVKDKGSFKEKLVLLLNWLEPSYKLNEQLIQMMNSMDADTKIDSKLYEEMIDESIKVKEINDSFEKVFESFPMESYKKNLSLIRKATNYIEDQIMVKKVVKVNQLCPNLGKTVLTMKKTLKTASKIEFDKLYAATKNLHGIIMDALKVKKGE